MIGGTSCYLIRRKEKSSHLYQTGKGDIWSLFVIWITYLFYSLLKHD